MTAELIADPNAAPFLHGSRTDGLESVEPSYVNVIRLRTLLAWLPFTAGAIAADRLLLADTPVAGLLLVAVPLLAVITVATAPPRIWARIGYALEPTLLRVVRGWMWHSDTQVPLVRVQHLDIARGPLDKMFGTATLAIHTAGTHNSIVTLPGLSPERATEMRDAIREHVRTDFA